MNKLEIITENYPDEEFLSADGFEDAIIGVAEIKQINERVLVYSRTLCIDILMQRDKMSYDEAVEYFDFNVEGAFMGEKTPIWVDDDMIQIFEDDEG